jgi:alcohol dehydrogenase class IV
MLNLSPFTTATLPRIRFGEGTLAELPQLISPFGSRILLLTGGRSFVQGRFWGPLQQGLREARIETLHESIFGEPSPQRVDELVSGYVNEEIDAVVGIGGGSVLDAAKAVAGLLPFGNSVLDHLEDVGRGLPYYGPALPFIAVPTTAGTGSEATRNAVLSEHGANGYKKSFRHDSLVARIALVDPLLLEACPPALIAAQGMDAFTQLLESYVSLRANPFTDALSWSGLEAVHKGFLAAYNGEAEGRAAMAYAAMISGITLAQVGLGAVHGLAQPLGSLFPLPHGVACGTMVAASTRTNLTALRQRMPKSPALEKYARVGRLLNGSNALTDDLAHDALIAILEGWGKEMNLPRLGGYGVGEADVPLIVANSRNNSMKTNPIELSDDEIAALIRERI